MGLNVHSCQVGDELLEPILLDIEQQATLALVVTISEVLGAEEDTELERHVESGKGVHAIQLGPGEIMDAIPALLDDPIELVDPGLRGISHFERTAGTKAAGDHRENQGAEAWREFVIKGAVDEDVAGVLVRRRHALDGLVGQICPHGTLSLSRANVRALGHGPRGECRRCGCLRHFDSPRRAKDA